MIAIVFAALVSVQPPPKRFDYPAKNVEVIERSASDVNRLCRILSGYRGMRVILACALPRKGKCVILFPRGGSRNGILYRHENAHCNGWRH